MKKRRLNGMQKLLGILLFFMMLSTSATALEVEMVQTGLPVDTIGGQMTLYRAKMDNGQEIYCMGREDDGLWHKLEDVNFDGYADFVTFPVQGARNVFAAFYVYQPERDRYEYAPVWNGQLCNYELDATHQWVISQAADGMRDGDTWIFAWKDGHLEPLRRLTVGEYEAFAPADTGYTITHDYSRYEVVIRDYTQKINGEIIYQQIYDTDDTGEADGARLDAARKTLFEWLE